MLAELPDSTSVSTIANGSKNSVQVLNETQYNTVWTPYSEALTLYSEARTAEESGDTDTATTKNAAADTKMTEATTAIRKLAKNKAGMLIFGCTADVFQDTRERMIDAGVDHIISKPIDETELDDVLINYTEKLYQFKPDLLANLQ